jgi:hypothetical protein
MALSNIINEPQREITETLVGVIALLLPGYVVYRVGNCMALEMKPNNVIEWGAVYFSAVAIIIVAIFTVGSAAILIHNIGEEISDTLQLHGIHIRPKRRKL